MSTERDFEDYFISHGWTGASHDTYQWTFKHPKIQGFVQPDAVGNWWHQVEGKVILAGHGLETLKDHVNGLLSHKVDRVDWTGKQHEKAHSMTHER